MSCTKSWFAILRAMPAGLIAFLGVDWEPTCLEFHKTRRVVRTASQYQVREPIHTHSVGRWRRYESMLRPFFEASQRFGVVPEGRDRTSPVESRMWTLMFKSYCSMEPCPLARPHWPLDRECGTWLTHRGRDRVREHRHVAGPGATTVSGLPQSLWALAITALGG